MPVYVSDLLTATAAPVNAVPTATRAWQWLRGSTAISGATSSTYTAVTADIGATIAASQIETNVAGTATATSAPTEVIQAFDPIRLFSASEPGVWYDPNDISTLFQDAAGTIPVTGPVGPAGQAIPVGLMLDKSRGGEQSLPTTGWTVNSGDGEVTIAGNVITIANATTTTRVDITSPGWVVGDFGRVTVDTFIGTSTGATVWVGGAGPNSASAGVRTYSGFVAASTLTRVQVGTGTATFTVISRSRTPGNHATQPTTASQPIYGIVPAGGRRNLLIYSQEFTDATWVKTGSTAANTVATTDPFGGSTADSLIESVGSSVHAIGYPFSVTSGTSYTYSVYVKPAGRSFVSISGTSYNSPAAMWWATYDLTTGAIIKNPNATATATQIPGSGGWWRLTYSYAAPYTIGGNARFGFWLGMSDTFSNPNEAIEYGNTYTGNGTSGIYIWGAQLEQSATATPYQRVTTQYDVTEAGVASLGYLYFDGSSDFMSTGTITPGTDKAQVFTGVRKLSDAVAMVAEFSPDFGNNAGSFGAYTFTDFRFASRGSATEKIATGGPVAPTTQVFTGLGDISGDTSTLRLSGVQVMQVTLDQGTGNYLAYPLYIGRRNATTNLYFNGQLFPLIVRFGPNLTTARISATESWVASKTPGVTL